MALDPKVETLEEALRSLRNYWNLFSVPEPTHCKSCWEVVDRHLAEQKAKRQEEEELAARERQKQIDALRRELVKLYRRRFRRELIIPRGGDNIHKLRSDVEEVSLAIQDKSYQLRYEYGFTNADFESLWVTAAMIEGRPASVEPPF